MFLSPFLPKHFFYFYEKSTCFRDDVSFQLLPFYVLQFQRFPYYTSWISDFKEKKLLEHAGAFWHIMSVEWKTVCLFSGFFSLSLSQTRWLEGDAGQQQGLPEAGGDEADRGGECEWGLPFTDQPVGIEVAS